MAASLANQTVTLLQTPGNEKHRNEKNDNGTNQEQNRNRLVLVKPISEASADGKESDEPQHKPQHDEPANLALEAALCVDEFNLGHTRSKTATVWIQPPNRGAIGTHAETIFCRSFLSRRKAGEC